MSLTADELAQIKRWIKTARPLKGIYYRSVEYRFMNPDEVLNGRGAELYGGRFAEVGTKAVYLAESDIFQLRPFSKKLSAARSIAFRVLLRASQASDVGSIPVARSRF